MEFVKDFCVFLTELRSHFDFLLYFRCLYCTCWLQMLTAKAGSSGVSAATTGGETSLARPLQSISR